jgi:hypothetical protein
VPIGNALLQPHTLARAPDDTLSLTEDLARLIAIFIEDAATQGPLIGAAETALEETGAVLLAWFSEASTGGQTRLDQVIAKLTARISPMRSYIDGIKGQATAIATDPELVLDLMRDLIDLMRQFGDLATLPNNRAEVTFAKTLIEGDLGLSSDFIANLISGYVERLRSALNALPVPVDAAARRRRNLAMATLGRLSLQARFIVPPAFDVEPIARAIHDQITSSGLLDALGEINCALDGIEAAAATAQAATDAIKTNAQPVGAGVVPRPDKPEYSYYASWVLQDENMPFYGLSDVDQPGGLISTIQTSTNAVITTLLGRMDITLQGDIASFSGGLPHQDVIRRILAALNKEIQAGPILNIGGSPLLTDAQLNEDIIDYRQAYKDDQTLYQYNRELLDHLLGGFIATQPQGFSRTMGRFFSSTFAWPRHQVFVTGDRRFVMCDDMPLHEGIAVKWSDATLFNGPVEGGMWFEFAHAGPEFCEYWAQTWTLLGELGKSIWHTLFVQPGHEAQGITICAIEYIDLIQQFLTGAPISGHFLDGNPHLRRWGKSLDSFLGLKGIATFFSSFQNLQSTAPNEKFRFWITVLMGDIFRTLGPISTVNTARDVLIDSVTLINHNSGLSSSSAQNHRKQSAWVNLSNSLFIMAAVALVDRDNYSIAQFSSKDAVQGAPQRTFFFGNWLGGGIGFGLLAGTVGPLIAMVFARQVESPRLYETWLWSVLKVGIPFPVYMYIFRENTTEGGTYRSNGASFDGYPERSTSPYLLPFANGTTQYVGQANLGLFSHNERSSFNANQAYAYDFGHDFDAEILCCRAGVVWSVTQTMLDGNTANWNQITIMHRDIDPVHDLVDGTAVQTFSVYGHLAMNGVTRAPEFGGVAPTEESLSAGNGTVVNQGDIIALAGDTGTSFHNHLHLHVLPLVGTGPGGPDTIPFVFRDGRRGLIGGNGNLQPLNWYRSENGS